MVIVICPRSPRNRVRELKFKLEFWIVHSSLTTVLPASVAKFSQHISLGPGASFSVLLLEVA